MGRRRGSIGGTLRIQHRRIAPAAIAAMMSLSLISTNGSAVADAISQDVVASADDAAALVLAHEKSIAAVPQPGVRRSTQGAQQYQANDVTITLPATAGGVVSIDGFHADFDVTLGARDGAVKARLTDSGLVAYDNLNDSYTVPIPGADGDLQINTVITSAHAPQRYTYEFDLSSGAEFHRVGESLVILDADESLVAMIAEPWATDATGRAVPTRYEVVGSVVTQVVDHHEGFAYPIVADPWLGVKLFTAFSTGTHRGQTKYNGLVTPQAVAVLGAPVIPPLGSYVLWLSVMGGSGWDEWKAKWPAINNKASLHQQYDCHVASGIYGLPFTRDYNLERSRPNRKNGDWIGGVAIHRCNWANATGNATN